MFPILNPALRLGLKMANLYYYLFVDRSLIEFI